VSNNYFIQLVGVLFTVAGMIALTASAHLFGTPLSPEEKRRASDEWNHRRDVYRLPINPGVYRSHLILFDRDWHPYLVEFRSMCVSCLLAT
jgi:hypothetical protein